MLIMKQGIIKFPFHWVYRHKIIQLSSLNIIIDNIDLLNNILSNKQWIEIMVTKIFIQQGLKVLKNMLCKRNKK